MNNDDLISRSALKKCAIPCEIHNGALTDLCVPLYQIDNAPTVQPKYFPPCEDCNKKMEEIRQAYDKMKAMKRPQGAWIKITNDGIMPIEYMCNICGRTVKSYYEEYLIEKVYPFCHCGADMREANNETRK